MRNYENNIATDLHQKTWRSLGFMTGTSMDGIDAAVIETNGQDYIRPIGDISLPFDQYTKDVLRKAESRAKQSIANNFSNESLLVAKWCYKAWNKLNIADIDIIGMHGQTLYHAPSQKISLQIGDAKWLNKKIHTPIVYNFRTNDILHGGHGAPLAPVYHQALVLQYNLAPCVVLNCGGIANITWVANKDLYASDVGPGNVLIDRFMRTYTNNQEYFDQDGMYGLQGSSNERLLNELWQTQPHSRSLDAHDFYLPPDIYQLSLYDACATLAHFSAARIAQAVNKLFPCKTLIICGGGGYNQAICKYLREFIRSDINIKHAQEVGWHNDCLEAQIFAYLAVRSILKMPISFPGTTGVSSPVTGGMII